MTPLPHDQKEYWPSPFYFRCCYQEEGEAKPSGRSQREHSCYLMSTKVRCQQRREGTLNWSAFWLSELSPAGHLVENLLPWKLQDAAVAAGKSSVIEPSRRRSSGAGRLSVYSRISGSLETDLCEKLFRRISFWRSLLALRSVQLPPPGPLQIISDALFVMLKIPTWGDGTRGKRWVLPIMLCTPVEAKWRKTKKNGQTEVFCCCCVCLRFWYGHI